MMNPGCTYAEPWHGVEAITAQTAGLHLPAECSDWNLKYASGNDTNMPIPGSRCASAAAPSVLKDVALWCVLTYLAGLAAGCIDATNA